MWLPRIGSVPHERYIYSCVALWVFFLSASFYFCQVYQIAALLAKVHDDIIVNNNDVIMHSCFLHATAVL